MNPPTTCTFCSSPATLVPTDECRVCGSCAKRIATVAAARDANEVWDAPAVSKRDEETEAFAARIAERLSSAGADVHFHLAMAYREMVLHSDAVREAASALAAPEDEKRCAAVLRLLLTPPLLRPDGLTNLRQRLTRMALN